MKNQRGWEVSKEIGKDGQGAIRGRGGRPTFAGFPDTRWFQWRGRPNFDVEGKMRVCYDWCWGGWQCPLPTSSDSAYRSIVIFSLVRFS